MNYRKNAFKSALEGIFYAINFKPTTDARTRAVKKIRLTFRGSCKKSIPITVLPAVPIPVHTAYAVPIAMVFIAYVKREKLTANPKISHTKYNLFFVSFSFAIVNTPATSQNPAITSANQAILCRRLLFFCHHF